MSGKKEQMPRVGRLQSKGYGVKEDLEGTVPWEQCLVKLEASRNYWVSTTRPNGRPHAAPVWGLWFEGAFLFGTGEGSRKQRNIAHNPQVVVHLESGDDTVIIEGRFERIEDKVFLERANAAYFAKYDVDVQLHGDNAGFTYVLKPETAFAWLETDFPNTATRYRFD